MIQKIAAGSLGLFLLVSPVVVSAATVAELQAQLESLLAQLLQLQTTAVASSSQSFTASATSGTAPLSVTFQERTTADGGSFAVDFGDGTGLRAMTCEALAGSNDSLCRVSHAYTMPGRYRAQLLGKAAGAGSEWQETGKQLRFAVYKPKTGSTFATIDQASLTTRFANPTISGTVVSADIEIQIRRGRVAIESPVDTTSQDYVWRSSNTLSVLRGHWSAQVAGAGVALGNGIYTVVVADRNTGNVLATGTLFVDASR